MDDLQGALARLVALGQSPDKNIRPVLLRVVVDLFVNKPHHAPDDLRQFELIASHLLDDADLDTRAAVAERLSSHPLTPRALSDRFLADEPAVAAKAYPHVPLDEASLLSVADWGAAPLAEAIARRPDLSAATVAALAARPEAEVVRALAANPAAALDRPSFQSLVRRARGDARLAALLIGRPADPIDHAPLFALARPEQRMAIIEAARRHELGRRQWGRLDTATAATLARLDRLILFNEHESFEASLALALGIDPATMTALLQDEGGEILALALAAVGASAEQAARAFILGDARIGRSVERVRLLTDIVATVSSQAARRLLGAMVTMPADTIRRATAPGVGGRRGEGHAEPAPVRREQPAPAARRAV